MEEINKIPLVVILQDITKKEIGKKGNKYVYLYNKSDVEQSYIDEAMQIQDKLYIKESYDEISKAIQKYLDKKAQEFRYDNIMSARSYTGYENPFKVEAEKLAIWASNCWLKAGEIEAAVKAEKRAMPSVDEVLSELPAFEE